MPTQQQTLYTKVLDALKRREGLLRILMFTLVTVFCWIGFSIFLSQKKTKVSSDVQKYTIPLNPNIDRLSLSEIGNRRTYTDQELSAFPIYEFVLDDTGQRIQTEIGTETVTLDASLSAQPVEQIATDSAEQSGIDLTASDSANQ